jgi:hypothetical protein
VASLFIMEQYLDGPEVDVDIVLSKGEAVYGSITVSTCRLLCRRIPVYSYWITFDKVIGNIQLVRGYEISGPPCACAELLI